MSELFAPERLQMMRQFQENFRYYAEHYSELRDRYRGKYIAIDKGRVVAENPDQSQLLRFLSQQVGDTRPIFIQYISEKEHIMTV